MTRGAAPAMAESETVIAIEEGGDRHAIVTSRLCLTFQWTVDRWSHALEWPGVGAARSVESDPRRERDEPARVISPAYQQVGFQRDGARVQALLVGQAGAHHFAAAFTVQETGGATVVEVDVADRCRSDVSALASTYAISLTSSDLRDADPARIVWETGGERLTFESAEPPSLLTLAEAGRSATRVQAGATIHPETATQRWAYRWVRGSHPTIEQ